MNTDLNLTIVAKWSKHLDPGIDLPNSIAWQNGIPLTVDEFLQHKDDTQRWVVGPGKRTELHLYPNIIAEVHFDKFAGCWAVRGADVTPAALDLVDPDATDDQIRIELSTFPIWYRARIHRESAVA